jgi:16S rRNA (cytosine1402-N4)-methyltransferase
MRMDTSRGESAADWINRASEEELREVIWRHGEERFAKAVAAAIVDARRVEPFSTTGQLAAVVARAVRTREPGQHPATRTFQAVRIHLNQELEELEVTLPQAAALLEPGGRLAVISFHSLEDRIVKNFIRARSTGDTLPKGVPVRAKDIPPAELKAVGKAIKPSAEEVRRNPRARSAMLRVAEKLGPDPGFARLNVLLLLVVIACALGVVTSQHRARKLFTELETEQATGRKLATEHSQLQLEQGTWATHARVEQVATKRLGMRPPDGGNTVVLKLEEAVR